jgi:hypothetical protein
LPNHPITPLASGTINQSGDTLSVELVELDDHPAAIRIVWPAKTTIVQPARYNEVASTVMRMLATASTELARIKARRRL